MKRMTKYEKRCWEAAKRIKPITDAQKRHAVSVIPPYIFKVRRRVYCSECGSEVHGYVCHVCCSEFKADEKPVITHHGVARQSFYYGVDTVCGGEQVKRHYIVAKLARKGQPSEYTFDEVSRDFVSENGYVAVQGLPVFMSMYYDRWKFGEKIGPRYVKDGCTSWQRHNISDYATYPLVRKAGWLKLRGYTGTPESHGSLEWKKTISKEPFAEWLMKKGHTDWLSGASIFRLKSFKRELELCDKHGYEITDISMWLDTVESYRDAGKDTLNEKWSRFNDLVAEHDKVMRQRRRMYERQERIDRITQRMKDEEDAMKHKDEYSSLFGKYAGLIISDNGISITAITDIPSLIDEGRAMEHCVASYYDEEDSLILSAKDISGNRLATLEWSISEGRVLQCRGKRNCIPEKYDTIMGIVARQSGKIKTASKCC